MAEWDVTATEHFDLGLKALETDTHNLSFPLMLNNICKNRVTPLNFAAKHRFLTGLHLFRI